MYRINPLPRKVLITTDEVIACAPVSGNVDPRNIEQAIQIAEERFIKSTICGDLYDDFRAVKNVTVTEINKAYLEGLVGQTLEVGAFINAIEFTNSWYQTLWFEHLWKLIAECVIYVATPTNWSKYTSAGEMINNPKNIADVGEGAKSIDLRDLKWKLDRALMDRIDPLIKSANEYLQSNASSFPFYNCRELINRCGNTDSSVDAGLKKTAWVHIYGRRRANCDYDKY